MFKLADLHIHTACRGGVGRKMGPQQTAQALVDSPLDTFAITEHRVIGTHLFDVQEEIDRLTEGTARQIAGNLGVELDMTFEGEHFHIGYVFEDEYGPNDLPDTLPKDTDAKLLEEYKKAYPGVAIGCHMTITKGGLNKLHAPRRKAVIRALIRTGLLDGVELLNSTLLDDENIPDALSEDGILTKHVSRKRLATIGSSDAHEPDLIGTVATVYRDNLIKAIREAETYAIALRHPLVFNIRDRVERIVRHIPQQQTGHILIEPINMIEPVEFMVKRAYRQK